MTGNRDLLVFQHYCSKLVLSPASTSASDLILERPAQAATVPDKKKEAQRNSGLARHLTVQQQLGVRPQPDHVVSVVLRV